MNEKEILDLQRLIDGECNEVEIRNLLQDAEQKPRQWKEIATAFIEDQFWRRQFQSMEPAESLSIDSPLAELPHDSNGVVKKNFQPDSSNGLKWLSLAACVTAAAMIGYVAGNDPASPTPSVTNAIADNSGMQATPTPIPAPSTTPKITPASLKPDYHLQLVDQNGQEQGSVFDGEVPLYSVDSPEQVAQIRQPDQQRLAVSPEMLKQLTGRGFRVRENVNYISGSLKDGRQFVVPVRTINFVPGQ